MAYKTILVHVDDDKAMPKRVEFAARLALQEQAHLIGMALTGVSQFLYETVATDIADPAIVPYLDTLRARAQRNLDEFEEIASRLGVTSIDKRLLDDEAAGGISSEARYADLVVVGQYDRDGGVSPAYANLPETIVMNGARPVLIIPFAGTISTTGDHVLIAWNGSIEATRAVAGALPMLQHARCVEVAVFGMESGADHPGAHLATYLERQGVATSLIQHPAKGDLGEQLLSMAKDKGVDLLVMGCYGHSRFRETLLGGVTRSALASTTIPILMAH